VVKEIKEIVTDSFTMDKHENKVGFEDTEKIIIGGEGRGPLLLTNF